MKLPYPYIECWERLERSAFLVTSVMESVEMEVMELLGLLLLLMDAAELLGVSDFGAVVGRK